MLEGSTTEICCSVVAFSSAGYSDVMDTIVRNDRQEPLTFANAPTEERDGRLYVLQDAALELVRRIAAEDASLLERLAQE